MALGARHAAKKRKGLRVAAAFHSTATEIHRKRKQQYSSMKLLTKLSLVAAAFTAIGTSAAFADDQQLQNKLALERAQNSPRTQQTTIAVYAHGRGIGRTDTSMNGERSPARFEMRSGHGQSFGVWVPAK